jgi:NAD(P)-dependent dehydrogenase (short-subunit alcohol dehydrogenase family)
VNKYNDCVAVVTGAGSGIGRQLALQLASAGAKLAISDINAADLAETAEQISKSGGQVISSDFDVANKDAVSQFAQTVNTKYGYVNLVINNAGVALASGPLSDTPIDEFQWLMGINFNGVLYGTKAFLPILEKAEWGHIVNISSIFGIISVANQSAYNASKFAVRGMTDALRQELELAGSHISCTTVHPGGIKTNIARNARASKNGFADDPILKAEREESFDKLARTSAKQAAEKILVAVIKNKPRLLIGLDAKVIDKLQRIWPTGYHKILNKLFGNTLE